jgi:hypothetical protein
VCRPTLYMLYDGVGCMIAMTEGGGGSKLTQGLGYRGSTRDLHLQQQLNA